MSADDYPARQRLNHHGLRLRALIADLREEARQQPADGLFSEGIVITKIQVALRIEEILSPPPPEPSRGRVQ